MAGKQTLVTQPRWSKKLFSAADLKEISMAVTQVETTTTAEIVPMLVKRSTYTGHAFWQILFLLLAVFFAFQIYEHEMAYQPMRLVWILLDIAFISGLATALSRWPKLAVECVPHRDRFKQVHDRAEIEFFEQHLMETKTHTGILLFVSLLERKAVVMADETIAKKIPQSAWAEVCDLLISGIREHSLKEGYVRALKKCEEILAHDFKKNAPATSELSNELIIKD